MQKCKMQKLSLDVSEPRSLILLMWKHLLIPLELFRIKDAAVSLYKSMKIRYFRHFVL